MRHSPGNNERGEKYAPIFDTSPEFFLDLFRFQTRYGKELEETGRGWKQIFDDLDPCIFHCHGNDAPCYLEESL